MAWHNGPISKGLQQLGEGVCYMQLLMKQFHCFKVQAKHRQVEFLLMQLNGSRPLKESSFTMHGAFKT